MIRPCPECGGRRVWVSAGTPHESAFGIAPLKLKQEKRKIPFLSDLNYSKTAALTCTQCGYTALYATHPHNLIPDE